MGLQPYEIKLFKDLLELATDALGNHGCNDFDLRSYLSQAQGEQMMKEFHDYNGDPEEYEEGEYDGIFYDYALLGFLASKLLPPETEQQTEPHAGRYLPPEHVSLLPLEVDCIYTEDMTSLEESYPPIDDGMGDLDHPL